MDTYAMASKTDSAYGVTSGTSILLIVIPTFTVKTLSQETFLQGQSNAISVSLQSNVDLSAGTSVAITGLRPTQLSSTANLTLSGTCSGTFNGFGTYDGSAGSFILTVSGSGFSSNTLCTFQFILENPFFAVDAPSLSIAASGAISISTSTVDQAGVDPDYLPLFVLGFVKKQIRQSNPSASAANTITVTFSLNREIKQQQGSSVSDKIVDPIFTLTGLTGSATPSTSSFTVASSNFSSISSSWTQSTGVVVFQPFVELIAFKEYEVHFSLLNPSFGQDARNISITLSATILVNFGSQGALLAIESMTNGNENYATMLVADFLVKFLLQSDPSAGATNKLVLTMSSRINMAATSACINITGFDNATSPQAILTLSDESAASGSATSSNSYFASSFDGGASTALFSNGIVSFCVINDIKARTSYSIGFSLQNPSVGQFSPNFYIQSIGAYAATTIALVAKGTGNFEPLLVAGASVSLSEQSAATRNVLTVRFSPYTEIVVGSFLNVVNLIGATNSNSSMALELIAEVDTTCGDLASCALHFSVPGSNMTGYGLWSDSPPSVVLQVVQKVNQSETVAFSFAVVNADSGQRPPPISFSYTGAVSSSSFTAATRAGGASALRIAGFNYSFMSQYQTGASELNTLNLTFQNFAILSANQTVITVSGTRPRPCPPSLSSCL
eukprot:758965-Hanusia_phi.AAC.1